MAIQEETALRALGRSTGAQILPVLAGPEALLEAIAELSPVIAARAAEMEAAAAVPPDLFQKLAATGLFRMLLPRDLGGGEFRLPDIIPVMEELARADGSIAWSSMIAAEVVAILLRFDRKVLKTMMAGRPELVARAPLTPRGVAKPAPGGFLVSGAWPLASGSYEAQWFLVAATVMEDDRPAMRPDGLADIRVFAVPCAEVQVLDTWRSIGLRATESDDVTIAGAFVPADRCVPYIGGELSRPTLARVPLWLALGPFHCSVVLGLARGMIDELAALLPTKRPLFNPKIRTSEDPLVQHRLAQTELRLGAARSFVLAETEKTWARAMAEQSFDPLFRARYRAMMAHVHGECMSIGDEVFALAGSTVLSNESGLQRRFRDLRAACQHVISSKETYRPFGALMMGLSPENEAAL